MKPLWILILLPFFILPGCSSPGTLAGQGQLKAVDYYVSPYPETVRRVKIYTSFDNSELAYIEHSRTTQRSKAAIVYLHGIESHAGWFREAADRLALKGYDIFCLDRRGSGLNRENRYFVSGDIDSYETLFKDIESFATPLHRKYGHVYLVGLSWGGKLGFAYVLSYPDTFDGLILITPGISVDVDLNILDKTRVLIQSGSAKDLVKIPIKPEMFTKDEKFLELIHKDKLRLRHATTRFFFESNRLDDYISKNATSNKLPVLLFLAGKDEIINNKKVLNVLLDGTEDVLDIHVYGDQTHSIQFDVPQRMVADMDFWIKKNISIGQ